MTALPDARPRAVRIGLLAMDLGVLALVIGSVTRTHAGFVSFWDSYAANVVLILTTLVALARPILVRRARGVWTGMGIAVLSWTVGNITFTAQSWHGTVVPTPSWDDLGYLVFFYPAAYIGLALQHRRTGQRRSMRDPGSWVDGLAAAMAVGACVAALVIVPVADRLDGSNETVATNLAYPIGDVILIGSLVGLAVASQVRGRAWLFTTVGLTLFAVSDSIYAVQSANGTYQTGTLVDMSWYAGLALLTHAAWSPDPKPLRNSVEPTRYAALLPAISGLAGLVVLVLPEHVTFNPLVEGLAGAAVGLGLLRLPLVLYALRHVTHLHKIASVDQLTALSSRLRLMEKLDDHVAAGTPFTVLALDLEGFTDVNAVLGYEGGDAILVELARRLRAVAPDCLLARPFSDEFVIVSTDGTDVVEAARAALKDPVAVGTSRLVLRAHAGVAVSGPDTDATVLQRRVEVARQHARAAGVFAVTWTDELGHEQQLRAEAAEELLAGIEGRQIVLHYQPQTDLRTDRTSGLEALVRWQHPERGLLFPDTFLPMAEQAGLQQALTAEVLRLAVDQAATWWRDGHRVPVSVNLSATDLFDASLSARVLFLLETHELPVEAVRLEITETVAMADPETAARIINDLRASGLEVALDDFGTGFSSLAYLRTLEVDELKIDRSLVKDLTADPRALAIVRSTLALAASLGLRVVAEGVETDKEWGLLAAEGCDIAQGYWRSRPLSVEKATSYLAAERSASLPELTTA